MKECSIIEDLLPLYNESLLQDETTRWLEAHLKECSSCSELKTMSTEPMPTEEFPSPIDYEKMMAKNKLKISIYQLIFVGISFFLAMRAVILEENFSFILAYTVLGLITYLFYRNYKIVILIAFVPVFLWQLGMFIPGVDGGINFAYYTTSELLFQFFLGAFLWGMIHLLFAIIGATIGLLLLKLFESEEGK